MTTVDTEVVGLQDTRDIEYLREGVMYVLRREVGNRALAEDLCNEAFRIVLERLRNQPLEDPTKLAAYLAQTARFLARSGQRAARRRQTFTGHHETIEKYGDPDADPSAAWQAQARAKAVRQTLKELPNARDREILVRTYLREEDKQQICRELNIDEAHFRRVVFRARERFRALLERKYRASDLYCFALT